VTETESNAVSLELSSLRPLHWVGVVATVTTAVVHLTLGVNLVPSTLGISFVLAGLGYLGGVTLLLLNYRRRVVYAVGIPFTLIQVILWYYRNFALTTRSFPVHVSGTGVVDKGSELILLAVLVTLLRNE
jgi:hypothetical protein